MRRRQRWVLALLVLAAVAAGCAGRSASDEAGAAPREPVAPQAEADAGFSGEMQSTTGSIGDDGQELVQMIVYTGELQLVVRDTGTAQEEVVSLVETAGGYIASSSSIAYEGGLRRTTLTVRVPAEAFNATMDGLRELALEVSRDVTDSEDVTQEYVDLESRLKALEVKAARLEELMEEAEDTEAVLAVYEELSETQAEIEQTKGRMQYLERVSAMATITVTLVPDELSQPLEIAGWRPGGTVKRAIEALIAAFQFLVDALIWIVLVVIPVLLFIGLLIYALIRVLGLIFGWGKRKKQPRQGQVEPGQE